MSPSPSREVEHRITVRSPAAAVYDLIANVEHWPRIFPPTVHVDELERAGADQRIEIWATANGQVKNWTSRRTLDPDRRTIEFRQERSAAPVAEMHGSWIIEPAEEGCLVRLTHHYRSIGDDERDLEWIDRAVDGNSRAELAALKANVEAATRTGAEDLLLEFEDSVQVQGSARDLYDFINDAGAWAERLPHVAAVELQEQTPGLQTLTMQTRARDGSVHSTTSIRVTFPHRSIAYKQTSLPALMSLHTGRWTFEQAADGWTTATSAHTVVINTENITRVLGPDAEVAEARRYVQGALSTNSLATLAHAKAYAESRR